MGDTTGMIADGILKRVKVYERMGHEYLAIGPVSLEGLDVDEGDEVVVSVRRRHPAPEQERITYTDEDGHERCPLGGCRLHVVSSDEGTSYYRPAPEGVRAAAAESLGGLEVRSPGSVVAPEEDTTGEDDEN